MSLRPHGQDTYNLQPMAVTESAFDPTQIPEKPTLDGIEAEWAQRWQDEGV